LPFSFPVDPNAEFQPGQIAQLNVFGNEVVCGVSDGTAPIGIIDDIKTNSFTSASIDEYVIVPVVGVLSNGMLVTATDVKTELQNAYILERSFISDIDVLLIPRNGVIVIPQGTPLNFDNEGSGTPDSVRVVTSYTYQIPNIPGDDSTSGSGRVTIWFQRIIAETNQFETNQRYPLNANLFVSELGLLTTRMPSANHSAVAIVTAPPSSIHEGLQFLWI
jgi:hypothetical protein